MNRYRIRDEETGLTYYHPNLTAAKKHAHRLVHANEDSAVYVDQLRRVRSLDMIETLTRFVGYAYHRHW